MVCSLPFGRSGMLHNSFTQVLIVNGELLSGIICKKTAGRGGRVAEDGRVAWRIQFAQRLKYPAVVARSLAWRGAKWKGRHGLPEGAVPWYLCMTMASQIHLHIFWEVCEQALPAQTLPTSGIVAITLMPVCLARFQLAQTRHFQILSLAESNMVVGVKVPFSKAHHMPRTFFSGYSPLSPWYGKNGQRFKHNYFASIFCQTG